MQETPTDPGTDAFMPTRQSLLSRLRDWQDQEGWREFFETYWRLIYKVARGAGLADVQAQEVVQNTFIYLAGRMPRFKYDRSRGSFKSWLRVVTRSRINVYFRKEKADHRFLRPAPLEEGDELLETGVDTPPDALDEVWRREWEENLLSTAFRRLRPKVSSQQLLIFRMGMSGELSLSQVGKRLGVNVAQVYLARHRVGKLFRAEVERLRRETE
jgi:RNA polymerase sigma factor (sigma-70 family)